MSYYLSIIRSRRPLKFMILWPVFLNGNLEVQYVTQKERTKRTLYCELLPQTNINSQSGRKHLYYHYSFVVRSTNYFFLIFKASKLQEFMTVYFHRCLLSVCRLWVTQYSHCHIIRLLSVLCKDGKITLKIHSLNTETAFQRVNVYTTMPRSIVGNKSLLLHSVLAY